MKRLCKMLLIGICAVCVLSIFPEDTSHAAAAGKKVYYKVKGKKKVTIGKYNAEGAIVYKPSKDGNKNYKYLMYLTKSNKKKTIVIPSGSKVYVNGAWKPASNTTIVATGAKLTFKKKSNAIFTNPKKKIKNLTIIGGVWRSKDKGGRTGSLFVFANAKNITMDGVDCNANYKGHAVEVIGCTNVTIRNCTINAIGKNPSNCLEEQVQIDIATKKTAPKIAEYGKKYVKGQTCHNVYIYNNTIKGARAVGVNWSNSEKGKWRNKCHTNINIYNNNLTGTTSEGLAYFNVIGGQITNNRVVTYATRTKSNGAYTIGMHIQLSGRAPASMRSSKILVSGNTIYGNRNGIYVKGYFNSAGKVISQLGTVDIRNNTVYCKKGAANAIAQTRASCVNYADTNNTKAGWF